MRAHVVPNLVILQDGIRVAWPVAVVSVDPRRFHAIRHRTAGNAHRHNAEVRHENVFTGAIFVLKLPGMLLYVILRTAKIALSAKPLDGVISAHAYGSLPGAHI